MRRRLFTPLKYTTRADLFAQLATMENAGLPFDKALGLLKLPAAGQSRLIGMQRFIKAGLGIAPAGEKSGLFTKLEAALLGAAINAGSPARTYQRLARFYAQRAVQVATIKSQLLRSKLTLIAALFLGPLPKLIGGTLSGGAYLLQCLGPLLVLAGLAYLIGKLATSLKEGDVTPLRKSVDQLLLRMPLFGRMHIRSNMRDFFESLALMLEAGLPILDALPLAAQTIQNCHIQTACTTIKPRIQRGATLARALENNPYVTEPQTIGMIQTGEESGALPEMLVRHADMESAALSNFAQEVATWLPRLVYALIAAWIIHGLLAGPGIVPTLPANLE